MELQLLFFHTHKIGAKRSLRYVNIHYCLILLISHFGSFNILTYTNHFTFFFKMSMLSCCVLASTFLFFHLNLNGVICRRHKIGSRMLIHSVCYTFWPENLTHVHLKQSLIRMASLPFGFCLSCLFFDCFVSPFVSYCLPLLFVDILQGYTLFCNHFFTYIRWAFLLWLSWGVVT